MTKKKKMKKKKKTGRKIAILLVLMIFVFITAFAWYLSQVQNPSSKQEAQDYFQVTSAAVNPTGREQIEENGTVWIIHAISVTFKAVGGDAHMVVVQSWAGSQPELIDTMLKDVPRQVILFSSHGTAIRKEPGGFPVTLRITSVEASGKIKFYLSD